MLSLNFLTLLLITILTTIILSYIMIRRRWIVAEPTNRGLHKEPIPTSGGIVILAGYLLYHFLISYGNTINNIYYSKIDDLFIILSLLLICTLGFFDDKFKVSKFVRFSAQIIISIFIIIKFDYTMMNTLIYVGLIVYFINSYNFMDGIDSLAVLQAIFIILSMLFLINEILFSPIILVSILSIFLFYNISPPKIFLGNSGSYFLGLFIIIFFIVFDDQDKVTIINSLILYTVFLVDTVYTIIVRFLKCFLSSISNNKTTFNSFKLSLLHITQAHCTHNYQKLTKKNCSHKKTTLLLMSFNLFWCLPLAIISNELLSHQIFLLILSCLPYILWCYKNKAGCED